MASYNEAILMGNLTADPELKYTTGGTSLCNFTLAVNNKVKDREEVLFMPCVVFGKLSEVVIKYCSKGKNILVNGRLVEERWETDDGGKRSRVKLYVNQLRLLGSPNNSDTKTDEEF